MLSYGQSERTSVVREDLLRDQNKEKKWQKGRSGGDYDFQKLGCLVVRKFFRGQRETSQTGLAPIGIHP